MTQDILVTRSGHVVTAELNKPPANFFDEPLLAHLADVLDELGEDAQCRAVVLAATGKHFCAGADFSSRYGASSAGDSGDSGASGDSGDSGASGDGSTISAGLYRQAVRIFAATVPIVAAVQGAAIGGGLGLACAADFRVASPESRFSANFSKLGFHQGFGLTVSLPEIVGKQAATELLYTSVRLGGERAHAIGLVDRLVPADQIRPAAHAFAEEIAAAAPLAVASIRATMRAGLADRVEQALVHELAEQTRLRRTEDFAEGVAASQARREPLFHGR
jgi:enoyl-CoA hydratase/carnithine racemase